MRCLAALALTLFASSVIAAPAPLPKPERKRQEVLVPEQTRILVEFDNVLIWQLPAMPAQPNPAPIPVLAPPPPPPVGAPAPAP